MTVLTESDVYKRQGLGLWLEPEVIGVRSPLAATLPDDAFFRRHGVRVSDSGRYLLDLSLIHISCCYSLAL